ncbi:4-hydroxy-2-oxovalerate aldolase [Clostridium sp. chh4-2]|uniref:4-hydroxy-2-oxovalerate aldolase n=1 Tax=Clostridium sp. chh4-2 TaxID=2067550 RepID=UPI000CCDDD0C|nr:4-hydroxy-2-oxovalerate aldolase [Clostridium sp. chh4-2]PNV58999.1 4-hydroxy-2-oxovalerate aldolase [Clostridium sp. chh4-2]
MVELMDCTLRDGANVVGKGFSAGITDLVLNGLTACHVPIIEFGNAGGIGAYEVAGFTAAETDQTYLKIAQKYLDRGSDLGMFLNAKRYREENVALAQESGLAFLRIGADAGDAGIALPAVRDIKAAGLKAFYSVMKAYILSPDQLAEEGKVLEAAGLDEITIMDSAGTMLPDQVAEYTRKLTRAVSIPVAFHGHNNLGLSAANAIAAYQNGAKILDCGLMGMARSAGNLATEICVAMMQRYGQMKQIDLYSMLDFIEKQLQPAMEDYHYHNPITPLDLILGLSGCHSGFVKKIEAVAREKQVSLFRLIVEVSAMDQKNPSEEMICDIADMLRQEGIG